MLVIALGNSKFKSCSGPSGWLRSVAGFDGPWSGDGGDPCVRSKSCNELTVVERDRVFPDSSLTSEYLDAVSTVSAAAIATETNKDMERKSREEWCEFECDS